jgi:hypothetical protein
LMVPSGMVISFSRRVGATGDPVPAELRGRSLYLLAEPRRSCPYAGTIRIRFKGFPRRMSSGVSAP